MINVATLSEAVQALRAGNRDESRAILDEILKQDPDNKRALLWRAGVGTTAEESIGFLEHLLLLEPDNHQARESLDGLRARAERKRGTVVESAPARILKRNCAVCDSEVLLQTVRCARCGGIDSVADITSIMHNTLRDEKLVHSATQYWEEKLRKNPTAECHYHLGLLNLNLRRNCEALYHFEEASRLGNDSANIETAVQTLRGQRLILAADADPKVLKMLRTAAVQNGYRFIEAPDGVDAIKAFEKYLPDIVILDFDMPGMDGVASCRKIRKQRLKRNVPVLMLSENLLDKWRGKLAGATAYMNKPLEESALLERVRKLLHQYQTS